MGKRNDRGSIRGGLEDAGPALCCLKETSRIPTTKLLPTESMEEGTSDSILTSDSFAAYLRTMAPFHQYSSSNIALIWTKSSAAGTSGERRSECRHAAKSWTGRHILPLVDLAVRPYILHKGFRSKCLLQALHHPVSFLLRPPRDHDGG